jgi:hypothetical protein
MGKISNDPRVAELLEILTKADLSSFWCLSKGRLKELLHNKEVMAAYKNACAKIIKDHNLMDAIFSEISPILNPLSQDIHSKIRHAIYTNDFKQFSKMLEHKELDFSRKYQDENTWIEHIIARKRKKYFQESIKIANQKDIFLAKYFNIILVSKEKNGEEFYNMIYSEMLKFSLHKIIGALREAWDSKYDTLISKLSLTLTQLKKDGITTERFREVIGQLLTLHKQQQSSFGFFASSNLFKTIDSELKYLRIKPDSPIPEYQYPNTTKQSETPSTSFS